MKKLTVIFAVLVLATTIKVSAQPRGKVSTHDVSIAPTAITKVGPGQWVLSGANLKEGTNRMQTKELTGTLVFVKKGDSFSEVIFTDDAGKPTRLTPTRGGTNGAPTPTCKTKLPDACFGSPDKNIGMCICKPGDISAGGDPTWVLSFQHLGIFKNN
jgi:hypothetical protein